MQAVCVDFAKKNVRLKTAADCQCVSYDKLVLATGT